MTVYINYNVSQGVNVAFTAIMIVPVIVIMCITYTRAPRSKDPARVTVTYYKALLPFQILGLVLNTLAGILALVYSGSGPYNGNTAYHAQVRIVSLAVLFLYIMDILLIMTLVEMGNGFLVCLTQTRTGVQKAMRYAAIGTCTILAILAIALFAVTNAEYSQYLEYFSDRSSSNYNPYLFDAKTNINTTLVIVTFVWSLVLVVFAALVFHKTKRNYVLKNSALLFLVATVLNLLTHGYMLIYICVFVLSDYYPNDTYSAYTAFMFVDPILNAWVYVAILSLVCAVVSRKHNGLWIRLQPWMGAQGPPALAAGPSSKGPGEQWEQPSDSHVTGV